MAAQYYKFMPKRFTSAITLSNRLRFCTLSYYRRNESNLAKSISDTFEGVAINRHRDFSGTVDEYARRAFLAIGIDAPVGARLIASGNINYSVSADYPIFCFSLGEFEHLRHVFLKPENGGYDACFRIDNLNSMVESILTKGRIVEMQMHPVSKYFGRIICGIVTYGDRTAEVLSQEPVRPNPFMKLPIFEEQSEVRILLIPRAEYAKWSLDEMAIFVPGLLDYFYSEAK